MRKSSLEEIGIGHYPVSDQFVVVNISIHLLKRGFYF